VDRFKEIKDNFLRAAALHFFDYFSSKEVTTCCLNYAQKNFLTSGSLFKKLSKDFIRFSFFVEGALLQQ